jgi:hypothetical protein
MATVVSSSVETAVEEAAFGDQADFLRERFHRASELSFLSSGWHGSHAIQTLEGLEGRFFWPDMSELGYIEFKFEPDKVGFVGNYKLFELDMVTIKEHETFNSTPNNPAVGFAFITLIPNLGDRRTTVVEGMFTMPGWIIQTMVLAPLTEQGTGMVFTPVRTLF